MSKSLRILHEIEYSTLEAVMIWNNEESDKFLRRSHIVYTDFCIHRQFLSDLTESVSTETIDVLVCMLILAMVIHEIRLSSRDSVLINHTVSQVWDGLIQNNWRTDIFDIENFSTSTSCKSSHGQILEL